MGQRNEEKGINHLVIKLYGTKKNHQIAAI